MTTPDNGTGAVQAQLVITLSEGGAVNVQGPIENRILCYGMLEFAKMLIMGRALTQDSPPPPAKPAIQVVRGDLPPFKGRDRS